MKLLPPKLTRSRSNSSSSSSSSSPRGTTSTSPTSSQKKHRFLLPRIGSSRRTRQQDASAHEIVEASSPARTPTSSFSPRGKGKLDLGETSAAASSSAASATSPWKHSAERRMQEIEQVFAQFDANGDGKISTEELQAVLASLGDEATREEAELMVSEVDADGDGYINLHEFMQMNRGLQGTEEEEMAAAFAIFDLEKKGQITAEGLQQVLQRLGGHMAQGSSMEDCKRMIRGVDRKGVGHVDFDDFKLMMTPLTF